MRVRVRIFETFKIRCHRGRSNLHDDNRGHPRLDAKLPLSRVQVSVCEGLRGVRLRRVRRRVRPLASPSLESRDPNSIFGRSRMFNFPTAPTRSNFRLPTLGISKPI